MNRVFSLSVFMSLFLSLRLGWAQEPSSGWYNIGSPELETIWIDPIHGSDNSSGSQGNPIRSISEAWRRIPRNTPLSRGYLFRLEPGEYSDLPNYWENRWGTLSAPIIFQGNGRPHQIILRQGPNIYGSRYLYFINLSIIPNPAGDAFHCERCDHVLLRNTVISGGSAREAQETIKVNQSQHFYIEASDIAGAHDNVVDFVSVQYGHVRGNRIHDAEDWCIYAKGGSSYLTIEGNEIFGCGTGGVTAGQGTGLEFIDSPWTHYEAYNMKVVNNIVHDTEGAGLGVNGGYNILLAFNTLYRVGRRSHGIEVVFGERSCDGMTSQCQARLQAGGWGTATPGQVVPIPNRNVFVYNNILLNPSGFQSAWQHFAVYGPRLTPASSNVPSPALTDTNLQIRGNLIWNGPANLALGLGNDEGCANNNPSCNVAQVLRENRINVVQADLLDPNAGNFLPGPVSQSLRGTSIPDFPGGDLPSSPLSPQGNVHNFIPRDYFGNPRDENSPKVGALLPGSAPGNSILPPPNNPPTTPPTLQPPPQMPSNNILPQLLSVSVRGTMFSRHGGRSKIAVLASRTSKATLLVRNLRTGMTYQKNLRGRTISGRVATRYSVSLLVRRNMRLLAETFDVFIRLDNRYGDTTLPLSTIRVRGRLR